MKRSNFILVFLLLCSFLCSSQSPRLVIVFVVDQLSYANFMKLRSYYSGGFKKLIDNGIVYHNAIWPHGMPCTAAGHTGLSTGALPCVHGIVNNDWFDEQGKKVACDADSAQ